MLRISYKRVDSSEKICTETLHIPNTCTVCTEDPFFGKMLVALAANTAGDATALYEWFESQLRPSGDVEEVSLTFGADIWTIDKSKNYSVLANMPPLACAYNGQDSGSIQAGDLLRVVEQNDRWHITYAAVHDEEEKTTVFSEED